MERLEPRIRPYAWGSREALARLTGRDWPTTEPEAELWMGAHEAEPSLLPDTGVPLSAAIAADPRTLLGAKTATAFDDQLPFLLKVLAPVQALSIQAHPSAPQVAAAGPDTYVDRWPKPEAFYALTDFHVFAGSRSFAAIRSSCATLGVAQLDERVAAAEGEPDPAYALLAGLLRLPPDEQARLADAVVQACADRAPDPGFAAIATVAQDHPSDIGLVVLLTLEHRMFRPGEYAFLPAGVLHAYLHGVAIEIMAGSDNIVRAGLTQKRLDVEELLRIADLGASPRVDPGEQVDGWTVFPADTEYFRLRTARLSRQPIVVPDDGAPRILLAIEGVAELSQSGETLRLEPGGSCFLSAADAQVTACGDATVFLAAPGL